MTRPEQHAATVREALHAMRRAGIGFKGELLNPDPAHLALDELVALAVRADELEAEREQLLAARENAYERLGRAIRQREDAEARVISVSEYGRKRAEAAEARADELQRERDEALQAVGMFDPPGEVELLLEQARREADQLRAALDSADAAFQWIVANHPKVIRELPTHLYQGLRRAALAGVQADSCGDRDRIVGRDVVCELSVGHEGPHQMGGARWNRAGVQADNKDSA